MENLMTNAQFNELVINVEIDPNEFSNKLDFEGPFNVDDMLTKLCSYWTIAKPILRLVKIITPPKIDKAIDELLVIVNKLCAETSEGEKSALLEKFAMVWGTVKPILVGVKAITGAKVDKVNDEIVKIGDLLAKTYTQNKVVDEIK